MSACMSEFKKMFKFATNLNHKVVSSSPMDIYGFSHYNHKCELVMPYFYIYHWEKVTTTNFTTSKTKKNIEKFANHHYIENPFLVDHYYDITTSKVPF